MVAAEVRTLEAQSAEDFEALYRQHAPRAVRLAYLLTGDRALAQDLVQDAFIKVASKFAGLRDPEAFGAYLSRTVASLANSYFRRRKLERAHAQIDPTALTDIEPAAEVDAREALWRAVGKLNSRQRSAIVLRFYLDAPDEEAAEILQCRPGTVRSLISRGLAELRQEVSRD